MPRLHPHALILVTLTTLLALPRPAVGATYTVTHPNDSGDGSLRQALINANATVGADTITFAIPGAGVHTIRPLSALPYLTDPVTINGTTQPGFAGVPLIELDGTNAGADVTGLIFFTGADHSVVRGLIINRFTNTGIGVAVASGVTIAGNYIGTDATGTAAQGNRWGVIVTAAASNNLIGGTAAGDRNLISGNSWCGVLLYSESDHNIVQGNYIGTNVSGSSAVPNTGYGGVYLYGSSGNTIGGTAAGARNLISGNAAGVPITQDADNNIVQGNYIGTDVSGTGAIPNSGYGVSVGYSSGNIIGGTPADAGNIIRHNGMSGVMLVGDSSTLISRNQISGNSDLGIDQGWDGVTPNDDGDSDPTGPQNFPVLTGATRSAGTVTVVGTFNSTANGAFTVEFFSNTAGDASGYGEGETFLGSTTVNTDGSGNAAISYNAGSLAVGTVITATAIDAANNTSEFSNWITVTSGAIPEVTIIATDATAAEGGGDNGTFTISRGADTAGNLTVSFTKSGTATGGSDYTLGASAVIPDGQTSVAVTLTAAADGSNAEPDETVILTLSDDIDYNLGTPSAATVTINRNGFTVTTADPSGTGSLWQAVDNANTITGTDTIAFDATFFSTPRTINPGATLALSQSVNINGPGAANVTLSGGGTRRVVDVSAGVTATLQNLTIADGQSADGAGIRNAGTLTMSGSTIRDNTASGQGGGIHNTATLTLTNSTLKGNQATGSTTSEDGGGALLSVGPASSVTMVNSTVAGNTAAVDDRGGLWIKAATVHLRNTVIANGAEGDCARTGGTVNAESSLIQEGLGSVNGATNENNLTGDPLLGAFTGAYFPMQTGSPAINAGSNALATAAGLTTDQIGNPRITGGFVDLGAYESAYLPATVTINATDASAAEGGGDNGSFTISRGTATTGDLTVGFATSGTATAGSDYTLGASAIIPDGQTSVAVTLTAAADGSSAEPDETVTLTLTDMPRYDPGTPSAATVTINRNGFLVTTADPTGTGSLWQAVDNANTLTGTDTIAFDATFFSTPQTIDPGATLTLSESVMLDGPGATNLTVSGGSARRVVYVSTGVTATLQNMTIADGQSADGGGIRNHGTLTVNNSSFSANSGEGSEGGGGINNHGTLTVNSSSFSGNYATSGGGILSLGGTLTVTGSTFSENLAENGGGITQVGGILTVSSSTFSANDSNYGAGIFNIGTLTITNSTLSGNISEHPDPAYGGGGALLSDGPASSVTIVNSTIAGNTAVVDGRGGLWIKAGTLNLRNTIVANGAEGDCARTGGTINAESSLIQEGLGSINGATNENNLTGDPLLEDFTGAYYPLQTGSPAINAGSNTLATAAGLTTDQIGNPRIRQVIVDLGAFESDRVPPPPTGDDPDGDGLTNLREFAFGTDPQANFTGPLAYEAGGNVTMPGQPVAINFGSNGVVDVRVVFGRRKDWEVAGLTYTVRFSVDLTAGSWVAGSATPIPLTGPASSGTIDAVSVAFPEEIPTPDGPRQPRFAQVVVSETP